MDTNHDSQDPLLPTERFRVEHNLSVLDKLVDALAALSTGKLPSQDQIARLLRTLLNSEFLKPDRDAGDGRSPSKVAAAAIYGTAPTSHKGKKVVEDVRRVVQALLQFGLEKNDDNKLQDLIYHLGLIEGNSDDVGLSTSKTAESSKSALWAGKQAAEGLYDNIPLSKEVSNDSAIFVHALQTLVQTLLVSSAFRLLLTDILSIFRDLLAHGVADVEQAASMVQKTAAGIEENVTNAGVLTKVDETIYDSAQDPTSVQEKGKEVARETIDQVSATARGIKEQTSEKAAEWLERGKEATDIAKRDFVERMQQVLIQAQKDPASGKAMRSMLILVRKYGDRIAEASDSVAESAERLVDKVEVASDINARDTYPPPTTLYPPKSSTNRKSGRERKDTEQPFEMALHHLKTLLERMAQGHSLDGLLAKFGNVVKDVNNLPLEVVSQTLEEHAGDLGSAKGKATIESYYQLPASTSNASVKTLRPVKKRKHRNGAGEQSEAPPQFEGAAQGEQSNAIRSYFTRVGHYLDRALDEPAGWVTSRTGQGEIERLFEDGIDLLDVVGKVMTEIGEGVATGDLISENVQACSDTRESTPSTEKSVSEDDAQQDALELRRRFRVHSKEFMDEFDQYISAVERDTSTMKLLRASEALGDSTSDLLFGGISSGRGKKRPTQVWSSLQWTEWVGWALPKIIRMVPFNIIPIPSLEAKSESGGWEAGLYALFVQGNAQDRQVMNGSVGAVRDGIETTLVPDQIIFKEWTEVRIDMAEEYLPVTGREVLTQAPPRVETTSRVRMHVDGIRAKVDGLGYYFKYGGSWLGYEDEGIMNVDVGMGHPHDGFGCDIEIEMKGHHVSEECAIRSGHSPPPDMIGEEVAMVGEGVEGEGDIFVVPEAIVSEMDEGPVGAMDTDIVNGEEGRIAGTSGQHTNPAVVAEDAPYSDFGSSSPEPLFQVVDVDVYLRGVRVKLEKSRHWILNKLLVQPLAGPMVSELVRNHLQEKIRGTLQNVALGFAMVARDAEAQRESRREKMRRQKLHEREEYISNMLKQGRYDVEHRHGLQDLDEEDEDSFVTLVEDWWRAIIQNGPMILQGGSESNVSASEDGQGRQVKTHTSFDASGQGVIYHQSTTSGPSATPPVVLNKNPSGEGHVEEQGDVSDLTLAVGGGAQVFVDKRVPFGRRDDQGESAEGPDNLMSAVKESVNNNASEALGNVAHAGTRWRQRRMGEGPRDWHSSAFDL